MQEIGKLVGLTQDRLDAPGPSFAWVQRRAPARGQQEAHAWPATPDFLGEVPPVHARTHADIRSDHVECLFRHKIRKTRGDSSWATAVGGFNADPSISGKVMLKVVPSPGTERTSMWPP